MNKLKEIVDWSKSFSTSMDALDDCLDIKHFIIESMNESKKDGFIDAENIFYISKKINDFIHKYKIVDLIIKAELIGLFSYFIKYADSIADFNKVDKSEKGTKMYNIHSALKRSRHYVRILVS